MFKGTRMFHSIITGHPNTYLLNLKVIFVVEIWKLIPIYVNDNKKNLILFLCRVNQEAVSHKGAERSRACPYDFCFIISERLKEDQKLNVRWLVKTISRFKKKTFQQFFIQSTCIDSVNTMSSMLRIQD